jgi:hypothetical protein
MRGPDPLREFSLFPCGLFVQQPHVFVFGQGIGHGHLAGSRHREGMMRVGR